MNERQNEILKETVEILTRYLNPSRIILFGSKAKGYNETHSDFDLAVDVKRPHISKERGMNEDIEKISGLYKIDVIYMPSVDEDFKKIVIKTGKVIYERRD